MMGASFRMVTGARKSAVNAIRRLKPCALPTKFLIMRRRSCCSHSAPIQKTSVKQFQSQQCVDLEGIVALTLHVLRHNLLDRVSVDEPALQAPRVEQGILNVLRQTVSVPHTEVRILVPAEKQTFKAEW